jgi:gentisate 1,2-dioxygenase
LRFIIEGTGAYTSVNGTKITMYPGDFILTPSWTYHDHGNLTDEPVIWLDALDIPTVNTFNASFAEHYPEGTQPVIQQDGESPVSFPYVKMRQLLAQQPRDPHHGHRVHYGAEPTLPTIDAWLSLLPKEFRTQPYRSTDATIFCVAEGRGESQIGDATLRWTRHDIFVVPSWAQAQHRAAEESVVFSYSDRPTQRALGFWREKLD